MMKKRLSVVIAMGLVCGFVRGEVSEAFREMMSKPVEILKEITFDDKVPGSLVCNRAGGSKRENSMDVVSNVEYVSAPCSMLMDYSRLEQSEGAGYYYTGVPHVTNGVAVLSLCFRADEGGTGIEIRTTGKKWISHTIGLQENVGVWSAVGGGFTLGRLNRYTWYRLTLWMSAPGNAHSTWGARLDSMGDDGRWVEGEPHEHVVDKQAYDGAISMFDFNGGFGKVYVDDIKFGVIRDVEL